jgi:uncharacterized protein YjbI with pentapeptide repeats
LGGFPALLLKSANFTDADLHSANLRGSSLEDASFEDADIRNEIATAGNRKMTTVRTVTGIGAGGLPLRALSVSAW